MFLMHKRKSYQKLFFYISLTKPKAVWKKLANQIERISTPWLRIQRSFDPDSSSAHRRGQMSQNSLSNLCFLVLKSNSGFDAETPFLYVAVREKSLLNGGQRLSGCGLNGDAGGR